MNQRIERTPLILGAFFLFNLLLALALGWHTSPKLGILYVTLVPALFYCTVLYLQFLQEKKGLANRSWLGHFRILFFAMIVLVIADGAGSIWVRSQFDHLVKTDLRYRFVYQGWLKTEFGFQPDLNLQTPGVYPPNQHFVFLNSDVDFDRWGFRREIADPYPKLSANETFNVLCVGSSVMFGITKDKGDLTAPDMLQQSLKDLRISGKPVRVYNGAIPGATTATIGAKLIPRYQAIRPNIIIFYEAINTHPEFIGAGTPIRRNSYTASLIGNRFRKWKIDQLMRSYSGEKYGGELDALVSSLSKTHAKPVFITLSLPFSETDPQKELAYWDAMTGSFETHALSVLTRVHNSLLENRAEANHIFLIDSAPVLSHKAEHFADHGHLSQSGMQVLAGLMKNAVQEVSHQSSANWLE